MITLTCPHGSPIHLYTSAEAASQLGIETRSLNQLASARNLGAMHGRDRLFTAADIDAMQHRKPGRPPKPAARPHSGTVPR